MTIRPPPGLPLPDVVLVSNRVLIEEAETLRAAMEQFGSAPQLGSPWLQDDEYLTDRKGPMDEGRGKLLLYVRHQAALVYVNAYDHMISLARVLGGDGAMPLFAQASLSRVVCEAAVRLAWFMDPDVNSAKRLVRGAVALYESAEQRTKGVRALPKDLLAPGVYGQMLESCRREREDIRAMIDNAGMSFVASRSGNAVSRLEMQSPRESVPLKINVTQLMTEFLPDSPSWYNVGSGITHSLYWGLRDTNHSRPGEPSALTPNVMDIGAAAESALSASELILDRCARMYGYDPGSYVQASRDRRAEVDALMRRAVTSAWLRVPTQGG